MRLLIVVLVSILIYLQYNVWAGSGGYSQMRELRSELLAKEKENQVFKRRNRDLQAKVESLKTGVDGIEELARSEMGMVKQGEKFYLVVE